MKDSYGQVAYVKKEGQKAYFEKENLPFFGQVSLGNMTSFKILVQQMNSRLQVGIEGFGLYSFEDWAHYNYVSEKLNLKFESDARAVADFINAQLGYTEEKYIQGIPDDQYIIKLGAE